eukprot:1178350-Prorocentrum_minimum.AAC.4
METSELESTTWNWPNGLTNRQSYEQGRATTAEDVDSFASRASRFNFDDIDMPDRVPGASMPMPLRRISVPNSLAAGLQVEKKLQEGGDADSVDNKETKIWRHQIKGVPVRPIAQGEARNMPASINQSREGRQGISARRVFTTKVVELTRRAGIDRTVNTITAALLHVEGSSVVSCESRQSGDSQAKVRRQSGDSQATVRRQSRQSGDGASQSNSHALSPRDRRSGGNFTKSGKNIQAVKNRLKFAPPPGGSPPAARAGHGACGVRRYSGSRVEFSSDGVGKQGRSVRVVGTVREQLGGMFPIFSKLPGFLEFSSGRVAKQGLNGRVGPYQPHPLAELRRLHVLVTSIAKEVAAIPVCGKGCQ